MKIRINFFLFTLFFSVQSLGSLPTLEELHKSLEQNFPVIKSYLEQIEMAESKVQEAQGSFDSKLKVKYKDNFDGYYQNQTKEALIEKPLSFLNSSVYGGYRVGTGSFPLYYDNYRTQEEGELSAGIAFSLWQNRAIDPARYDVRSNKIKVLKSEAKLIELKNKVYSEASKKLWGLVISQKIKEIYQELLDISLKRDKGLSIKIQKGDTAAIYKTENDQYIFKRQSDLIGAERYLNKSKLDLSLYWRDEAGKPIIPKVPETSITLPELHMVTKQTHEESISRAINLRPEVAILRRMIDQAKLDQDLGENKLVPKVDVGFDVSRDYGREIKGKEGTEAGVLLKLEIPLERDSGKGKVQAARAETRGLTYELQYLEDQIKAEISDLYFGLEAAFTKFSLAQKEAELAEKLSKAEIQKWEKGASNFFTVNVREQYLADAKIKVAQSYLSFQQSLIDYKASIMEISFK